MDGPQGLTLRVEATSSMSGDVRDAAHALFETTYEQANHDYLDRSLEKLGRISTAVTADGRAVAFALGELCVLDLPRLPGEAVFLAGICCVHADFRRMGLFRTLENLCAWPPGSGDPQFERVLNAGRMAHPVSFRSMSFVPSAVPRPGWRPTELQQEVGAAIAELYGVAEFDRETFVCRGTGQPIGYPSMTMEVEPHEWTVFEPVDRTRGDALLGLAWGPTPPPGW